MLSPLFKTPKAIRVRQPEAPGGGERAYRSDSSGPAFVLERDSDDHNRVIFDQRRIARVNGGDIEVRCVRFFRCRLCSTRAQKNGGANHECKHIAQPA